MFLLTLQPLAASSIKTTSPLPEAGSYQTINQQDKVNYAVSEREDRVTDLTMLTRMTGCTGMYWAATGLQMGCTEH